MQRLISSLLLVCSIVNSTAYILHHSIIVNILLLYAPRKFFTFYVKMLRHHVSFSLAAPFFSVERKKKQDYLICFHEKNFPKQGYHDLLLIG